MKQTNYEMVRETLKSGDLVAFGGAGFASAAIKIATNSNVSHVGIVLNTHIDECERSIVQLIESTSLGDGFAGVQINRMSVRVAQYKGRMWVLPLALNIYLDRKAFINGLVSQVGKPYDLPGAVAAGWDLTGTAKEDMAKVFCSELVAYGLREGGALSHSLNVSEETPIDNCEYEVWDEPYQILGREQELR